jgi:hypothetical protein
MQSIHINQKNLGSKSSLFHLLGIIILSFLHNPKQYFFAQLYGDIDHMQNYYFVDKGNILILKNTNYTQPLQQRNALKHYGCTQLKKRKRKVRNKISATVSQP